MTSVFEISLFFPLLLLKTLQLHGQFHVCPLHLKTEGGDIICNNNHDIHIMCAILKVDGYYRMRRGFNSAGGDTKSIKIAINICVYG